MRLAEIVYTKCTTFVTFPSGDNLGRYEVRIFPSVIRVAIGMHKLCLSTLAENLYDSSSPPPPRNEFRNSPWSNLQIHGYDCQRINLVKVWIIILRVVDNPWYDKWCTR